MDPSARGTGRTTFGALLLGIPVEGSPATLTYVGKVGTGFSRPAREELLKKLEATTRRTSPFSEPLSAVVGKDLHWVRPTVVGEVRFSEWTPDGRLRHPVWRGVQNGQSPLKEVRR